MFSFTAAGVKCRVSAVKSLPVLHHSVDSIFISFGIIGPIRVTLRIEDCLSRCSGMYTASQTTLRCVKRLNNNTERRFFILLRFLCFQRQHFKFYYEHFIFVICLLSQIVAHHPRLDIHSPVLLQQHIRELQQSRVRQDMMEQLILPLLHVRVQEAGQLFQDVLLEVHVLGFCFF